MNIKKLFFFFLFLNSNIKSEYSSSIVLYTTLRATAVITAEGTKSLKKVMMETIFSQCGKRDLTSRPAGGASELKYYSNSFVLLKQMAFACLISGTVGP